MRNFIIGVLLSVFIFQAKAQVGINTTDPKAQLDVSIANPSSAQPTDGILIPRINSFPSTEPSAAQHGMMVFLLNAQTGFPSGFYFWNASSGKWEGIGGKAFSDFYKVGTTQPSTNQQDAIFRKGNVSIGGETGNVKLKVMITPEEDIITKTGLEVENASSSTKNVTYGILSNNKSVTSDKKYGIKSNVSSDGTGIHYGIFNEVSQNTNEEIYGIYSSVGKTFGSTKTITVFTIKLEPYREPERFTASIVPLWVVIQKRYLQDTLWGGLELVPRLPKNTFFLTNEEVPIRFWLAMLQEF
ncbi:hypothetical protein [Salinimicrobium soli]|uniref:hypothetical protein n=1 Tax=Salinimicrobium soli TaxID=1254399 RepID=UPI003AAEF015